MVRYGRDNQNKGNIASAKYNIVRGFSENFEAIL